MKTLVLYTMKGCPHCIELKKHLKEQSIKYLERDIDVHQEEYDAFAEEVGNDFVPAFMIIETKNKDVTADLFAPERDYNLITEALDIIKQKL